MKQKKQIKTASHKWLWIALAFVIGFGAGIATYYTVENWNGFFARCEDGSRPDKNGCCSGEVYTDAGDGWMVCCPDGGENCFPPIK